MDTPFQDIGVRVLAALETAGYKEETIDLYRKAVGHLALLASDRAGAYSPDLGAAFELMTTSPRTGKFSAQRCFVFGRLVGLFDSYVRTGQVDLSVRRRGSARSDPGSSPHCSPRGPLRWSCVAWP